MVEPWFEPITIGAWYGAIVGSLGGLLGGTLGSFGGLLVRRGRGRTWIMGMFYCCIILGICQLLFGAYAIFAGQPWDIWFGPILGGFIFTTVFGCLTPVMHMQYRQAEERRLDAEALRNG
ncbi:MAG TPA: hypothetical protein VFE46_12995 [Pirellulales bacterium]|jgi:heme A synthase|nr:hypothetical protein [Pirellulales bacterium]